MILNKRLKDVRSAHLKTRLAAILIVAFAFPILTARSAQHSVVASGFSFVPPVININVGDTIVFSGGANFHTATGSSASEAFCGSGLYTTCMVTFDVVGSFPYHCIPHRSFGMTGLVNVAGANLPPTVTLTSPTNGSVFSAPGRFTISANAMDTGGGTIGSVQFFAGATSLGSDTDSPYQVAVSNLAAGMYVLTARARDNQNAMATSGAVNISVLTPAELRFGNPVISNGQLRVSFSTTPQLRYAVEAANSLGGSFTGLSTNTATGNSITIQDPVSARRFYRAFVLP